MEPNYEDAQGEFYVVQNQNRLYVPLRRQRELSDLQALASSAFTVEEMAFASPKLAACLQWTYVRHFARQLSDDLRSGKVAHLPVYPPVNNNRESRTLGSYYSVYKYETKISYIEERQNQIDCLQSELRARLDVTERVVMSAFAERFERLNQKYKPLLNQLHNYNVQFYTPSMLNMDNPMDVCSESESFHSTSSVSGDSTTLYCSTCSSTTVTSNQSD
ncbi:hypothetical protein M3Y95_00400400 [Aphelenchoides besseyi]|nr:hypothetical protein M3Y95_00400400 [Aphelenchoides besseyi]